MGEGIVFVLAAAARVDRRGVRSGIPQRAAEPPLRQRPTGRLAVELETTPVRWQRFYERSSSDEAAFDLLAADTLVKGGTMTKKIDEWPWNRAWPWVFFITPIVLFTGWLWWPVGSCSQYNTEDYAGDTSCYVGPPAGYAATWTITAVSLLLVTGFAAGLVRAVYRRRRGYRRDR